LGFRVCGPCGGHGGLWVGVRRACVLVGGGLGALGFVVSRLLDPSRPPMVRGVSVVGRVGALGCLGCWTRLDLQWFGVFRLMDASRPPRFNVFRLVDASRPPRFNVFRLVDASWCLVWWTLGNAWVLALVAWLWTARRPVGATGFGEPRAGRVGPGPTPPDLGPSEVSAGLVA